MIYLGYSDDAKRAEIQRYVSDNGIRKLVVISADEFPLAVDGADQVKYSDVIMYVTFYRLLQAIDSGTLVVLNECLRTQNRYDLAYNCIRNYLNLTRHQLIFQLLPQIDTQDDFMVLFDFDTQSRWKRRSFDADLIARESRVTVERLDIGFERVPVRTSDKTRARYAAEREALFAGIGSRDPHTLPRNLYLIGGADKLAHIVGQANLPLYNGQDGLYVARNKRLGRADVVTYADVQPETGYTILELPHRFIDYTDFVKTTWQTRSVVLTADLKVDDWYFTRYCDWSERIHGTYANLSQ
jgi:hypothetical protein